MKLLKCDICGDTATEDQTKELATLWSALRLNWLHGPSMANLTVDVCHKCGPHKNHRDGASLLKRIVKELDHRPRAMPACPSCSED